MDIPIAETFTDNRTMTEPQQFPIYQSEDVATRIDVMVEAESHDSPAIPEG